MKTELESKILEAIFVKTGGREENPKIAKICAEIGDSYAMQEAIEFAEWINKNGYDSAGGGFWKHSLNSSIWKTTQELYNLFKEREK